MIYFIYGTLNDSLEIITGGQELITMKNGATTNQYTKISKYGNVVHLFLDITLPANATAETVYALLPYPPVCWYVVNAKTVDLTTEAKVQMGYDYNGKGQIYFHNGLKPESTRYTVETTYICQ